MMYVSPCACKGIRSCNLCEPTTTKTEFSIENSSNIIFIYCDTCRQAIRIDIYELNSQCPHHNEIGNHDIAFPLDGIYLVSDFITENEETNLINFIDNDIWIPSQSGRLKQDFGIKINFKKQTIKTKYFTGMPMYSKEILQRLQTHRLLNNFQSVELCNLDYRSERGSHIDPHIDDIWIWGERLITINLFSNTILSLISNNEQNLNKIIYIPLPRRWMIVLYGDARYEYKHAIQRQHINERRLAITFRELTGTNEKFYEENKDLYEKIIRISKRFTGISVGRFEQIVNDINTLNNKEKMDIDNTIIKKSYDELKELIELIYQRKISWFEIINSSTFDSILEKKYLIKLFSNVLFSLEQLKSIFNLFQLNIKILDQSLYQSHIIIIDSLSNQQIGYLLGHWRLITRQFNKYEWKNSFDNQWFNQEYEIIINKKKNNYPFLLSNLFTCQEQLSLIVENQFEYGFLWNNPNEQSFYLFDLAITCLMYIDDVKEIVNAYEEIIQLTDEEINYLDIFIRLKLILILSHNDNDDDDEKQYDLLEQLSSNVFFVRNLVR